MEEQQQRRTAWERQLLIRDKNRPTVRDYIPRIFTDFYEMHGDRNFGDDGAIIGGIGRLDGIPVKTRRPILRCPIRRATARHSAWHTRQKSSTVL